MAVALLASTAFGMTRQSSTFVEHSLGSLPEGIDLAEETDVAFAPDGSRVAFVGTKAGKLVPVVGTSVGDAFDYVDPPLFDARGEHVAFRVGKRVSSKAEKWWVFVDGKQTGEEDWIGALAWSPVGAKLAYWTQPGAKLAADGAYTRGSMVMVVGGKSGAKWEDADALTPPLWSADGKVVAALAMKGDAWCVLLGDKPARKAPFAQDLTLSADGKSFAFATMRAMEGKDLGYDSPPPDSMNYEVVAPKTTLGRGYLSAGAPVLSPNGKSIAYKAHSGSKVGIAIDDEKARLEWDFVTAPVWSPDGKHVAFAGVTGCTIDAGLLVVRAADLQVKGGRWQLVVDSKPVGEPCDEIRDIVFSDDGKLIARRARSGAKWRMLCGEQRGDEFDHVGEPQFDATGRHVAFGARTGRELAWHVLTLE